MKYINTTNGYIEFIDTNGIVTEVPFNSIYTYFQKETVSFLLLTDTIITGKAIFASIASDLTVNGQIYAIDQLKNILPKLINTDESVGFKAVIVDSLPATGENGIIYLVPRTEGGYTEYIWVEDESKFEEIGDTNIDLTDYIKFNSDDNVELRYKTKILGVAKDNTQHEIIGIGEYDEIEQVEVGSETIHLNLNTDDKITVDTPNGKEVVAYQSYVDEIVGDINSILDNINGEVI